MSAETTTEPVAAADPAAPAAESKTDTTATTATTASENQNQNALPEVKDPKRLTLFYDPPGTLRLTVEGNAPAAGGYSYHTVKMYQASPLSMPSRYLSLQDGKSEEIALVPALSDLNPASREAAEEELRRRYLTATVRAVTNVKTEFGITYWHVATDRGERDFVVQSLSESCVWLSDAHILLIDVDGNRFEIPDRFALDAKSQENLSTVL